MGWFKKSTCVLIFFVIIFLSSTILEAADIAPKVSVLDKDANVIASKEGLIIDHEGIIAIDTFIIRKWLDDVQNKLIVSIGENIYSIERLMYFSKKRDIAIFSINKGETKSISITNKRLEFIRKSLDKRQQTTGSSLQTLKRVQKIPAEDKRDSLKNFRERISDLYKTGKYMDAINVLKRVLDINPSAEDYNKLGVIHMLNSNYPSAIDAFKKAKDLDPALPETYFNLGIASYLEGKKEQVFEYYLILKRLDNKRAEELFDFAYR